MAEAPQIALPASAMLLLFYSSGAGVYRKPAIGWNTIYTLYFTLSITNTG